MRTLLTIATLALLPAHAAQADDMVYVGDDNEVTITGVIESMDDDGLDLRHSGKIVEVETDDINDFDDGLQQLLDVGDTIQISGRFDNEVFEAKRVLKVDNQNNTPASPDIVEGDQDDDNNEDDD